MLKNKSRVNQIYEEINSLVNTWWEITSLDEIKEYLDDYNNPNHDIIQDLYNELLEE